MATLINIPDPVIRTVAAVSRKTSISGPVSKRRAALCVPNVPSDYIIIAREWRAVLESVAIYAHIDAARLDDRPSH
jgi:hypothetical protein